MKKVCKKISLLAMIAKTITFCPPRQFCNSDSNPLLQKKSSFLETSSAENILHEILEQILSNTELVLDDQRTQTKINETYALSSTMYNQKAHR